MHLQYACSEKEDSTYKKQSNNINGFRPKPLMKTMPLIAFDLIKRKFGFEAFFSNALFSNFQRSLKFTIEKETAPNK